MTVAWLPAQHGEDNRNLQRRAARGTLWAMVDNWGRQLLQLVVFVVLARLLVPDDFGLVALAVVFVALATLFVDQGLGDAIIQRPTLTREHIDTAFWAALTLGAGLTVAGVVLAVPIAALLNEPRLEPVLQALSATFLLTGFAAIPTGVLRREMRFRSLAMRTLLSIAGGGLVGIAELICGLVPGPDEAKVYLPGFCRAMAISSGSVLAGRSRRGRGVAFHRVDTGEVHPLRPKATPILLPDDGPPPSDLAVRFRAAAAGLDGHLKKAVLEVLDEFAGAGR